MRHSVALSTVVRLSLVQLLGSAVAQSINGIELRDMMEEMEHHLVDNAGMNNSPFVAAVNPCSNYVGFQPDAQNRREITAAEWVRVAFHDFVTGDVATGMGGLDGSVAYETDRQENKGVFINDTIKFFAPTTTAYFSMADHIALGVVVAVAECAGTAPGMQPKAGRIDAMAAGPSGVPTPLTGLPETLARFGAAGFSPSDTIALTACGHTLGGVRSVNFPDIIPASTVTPTNLDGGVSFDSTPSNFDAGNINEYLNNTGSRGGPLITTDAVASRSDLRLYTSDGNATVQSMSAPAAFQDRCNKVMQQMIDVVPRAVTLSPPVMPMPWKAMNICLDITPDGEVTMAGLIRALAASNDSTAPRESVTYHMKTADGTQSDPETTDEPSGNGTSLFGTTTYWAFNSSMGDFEAGTAASMDFEDMSYPVNDRLFVLPMQSRVENATGTVTLRAAALTSMMDSGIGNVQGMLYVPTPQPGSLAPRIANVTVEMKAMGTAGEYTLFDGSATVVQTTGVIAKVVLGDEGSQTVKTDLFAGHA
ncbi:uncharacterized protein L3040_007314 [Drepanopeziza brunnea f. sp. 'multigermtubi']|uniref:uncharacterized protein n=1 Tax=Drepanopeziza brunnea f. sp. 'multigermtubi' TaxID=698441 RepID=UPI00238C6D14|nr:hypothetical protein L3040_007314 [Drepanopeziza brunnea f. sp. 'multigermtubi']